MTSKLTLLFFLTIILSIALLESCTSKEKNIKITLAIDPEFCTEDQWVYMFAQSGNNLSLEDSARIGAGHERITLYGFAKYQKRYELFFEKHGPGQMYIVASPGEDIFAEVKKGDDIGMYYPEVKGSDATNEMAELSKYRREVKPFLAKYTGEFSAYLGKDSCFFKTISDSIESIQRNMEEIEYKIAKTSKHPFNVWISLTSLELAKYMDTDSVNALVEEAQKRFPDYMDIQYFNNKKLLPETTQESGRNFEKRFKLFIAKINMEKEKHEKAKAAEIARGGSGR